MAPAELTPALSTPPISRRNVSKGLAWSVPAVAAAAAAPAFAASAPQCYSLDWTTSGQTTTGTQTVAVTGTTGTAGTATVTTAATANYRLPGGTAYTPLNMTSGSTGVAMSNYVVPGSGANGNTAEYTSTTITFPKGTTGPISFTISDLDSYTSTADAKGASPYTDKVQVLVGGVPLAPTSTSGATYASGWTTASGTSQGYATYTITDPTQVEIRLMNAYTGTISGTAHPNQTINISDFVCGSTPPAPVVDANPTYNYRQRASVYGSTACGTTTSYSKYNINNITPVGTSPYGFQVVNMPQTGSTTVSPATTITASNVTFVLGLPKFSLNQTKLANPFTFLSGGSTWVLDQSKTYEQVMTAPGGTATTFVIYTFNFTGPSTNTSVNNVTTSGSRPSSWPGSQFNIDIASRTGATCYQLGYFWGGYTGTFTAANGGTVTYDTLPPQWVQMY